MRRDLGAQEKGTKRFRKEDKGRRRFAIPLPKDKLPYHEKDLPLQKASSKGEPEKHIIAKSLIEPTGRRNCGPERLN
jgi:hypothetical protein